MKQLEIEGRSFEKSIVRSIREARTEKQFAFCATMIKRTILRFNHDEVAAAWNQALAATGITDPTGGDYGVDETLMAKKARIKRRESGDTPVP